jgi:hypothetical protein
MDARIITRAILELSPTAEFSFKEDDLSTLEWHNSKAKRPTDEEILAQYSLTETNIAAEASQKIVDKEALLKRLGITAEEAALLLL